MVKYFFAKYNEGENRNVSYLFFYWSFELFSIERLLSHLLSSFHQLPPGS